MWTNLVVRHEVYASCRVPWKNMVDHHGVSNGPKKPYMYTRFAAIQLLADLRHHFGCTKTALTMTMIWVADGRSSNFSLMQMGYHTLIKEQLDRDDRVGYETFSMHSSGSRQGSWECATEYSTWLREENFELGPQVTIKKEDWWWDLSFIRSDFAHVCLMPSAG